MKVKLAAVMALAAVITDDRRLPVRHGLGTGAAVEPKNRGLQDDLNRLREETQLAAV